MLMGPRDSDTIEDLRILSQLKVHKEVRKTRCGQGKPDPIRYLIVLIY